MSDDDLRMCAYYYSFRETNELAIDRVLSAVACAGKAYHHTDSWTDEPPEGYEDRRTEAQKIQDAANDAAQEIARLTRERDSAREAVRELTRERDEARAALAKIDAIRDDIIGRQSINWSAHIYPLVKALGEAGYEGAGYDVAHKRARTADDAIRELVEALRPFAAACDGQGNVWPVAVVGVDGEHWRRARALVKKYGVAGG